MKKIYCFLAICLVAFKAPSQIINSKLLLYLPFINSTADSGIYKLPVKSLNNSFVSDHLGNAYSALAIKGQLSIQDTSLFRLRSFSIVGWFYFDTIPHDTVTLISKGVGTKKSSTFIISCTKNKIICKTGDNNGYTDSLSFSLIFERHKWFHVAFTVDSLVSEKRLYVNAAMVDSSRKIVRDGWDNHPITIGANYVNDTTFSHHISGGVDDLRIYEEKALYQNEISKIMKFGDQDQLFSKWKSVYWPFHIYCGGALKNNAVSFKIYPNIINKSSGAGFIHIEFDSEDQVKNKYIQIINESGIVMSEVPVTGREMEIPVSNLMGLNFIQILNQNKTAANNVAQKILVVE